jgi:hypothetical protein
MPGDLYTTPGFIPLSPISLANRRDLRKTRGNWPLARNPDKEGMSAKVNNDNDWTPEAVDTSLSI